MSGSTNGETCRILGIAGSLREKSTNRGLLRAAAESLPPGVVLETFDLRSIPIYNGDVEAAGVPEPVQQLKARIAAADAVLIVAPEYNHTISGVLKNTIDWVSRPVSAECPWRHKPVGITGASVGAVGTARAQYNTRQALTAVASYVMPDPTLLVGGNVSKFDGDGNLTDEATRKALGAFMAALVKWAGAFSER